MPKGLEESVRRRLRGATYVFLVSFSAGTLGILYGEKLIPGTVLEYVIRGSIVIGAISGFYIAIVSAWNCTLEHDD